MRNLISLCLLLSCTGFFSCQKEITLTNPITDTTGGGTTPSVPPSTNGELVVRVYGKSPSPALDSNVTYYTYNSAKRVISRHILIYAYGQTNDTWDWYERDAAGLITRSRQYAISSTSPIVGDTTVTNYRYTSGSTPQLHSSVQTISLLGISLSDSTVYTYNSAGKVTKSESYQSNFLITTPTLSERNTFTYDAAGNVTKIEQYTLTGPIATLVGTQTIEWDNRTAAISYTEAESLIITGQPAPVHNPTKFVVAASPINSTNTFTYTYNSAGKPSNSVSKAVNTNFPDLITNFTIYYQ